MKLDKRMKTYEYVTRNYLTRRTPVIVRSLSYVYKRNEETF